MMTLPLNGLTQINYKLLSLELKRQFPNPQWPDKHSAASGTDKW